MKNGLLDHRQEVGAGTSLIQSPPFNPDLVSGVTFWTSTTLGDSVADPSTGSAAYVVNVWNGYVSYEPFPAKTDLFRVWAVRDGTKPDEEDP